LTVSRPHAAAYVAGHDAPLIGEHAATRGRVAMEGGNARAGVRDRTSESLPWRAVGTLFRRTSKDRGVRLPFIQKRKREFR
jgi:hypothetical protein